jgi:hypothetical protein
VVNAMHDSPWGTFTVFATIPIAMIMGMYLYWRPNGVGIASVIGVVLLFLAIIAGPYIAESPMLRPFFDLDRNTIAIAIPVYGLAAADLVAAMPAGLPLDLPQNRHDHRIGNWYLLLATDYANASGHRIRQRRRTDYQRTGVPIRVHHHRMWRGERFSRDHCDWHDAENDQ